MCWLKGLTVDTGVYNSNSVSQPTHSTYGIKMPGKDCASFAKVEGLLVVGFDTGVLFGEHTEVSDMQVWTCVNAIEIGNQNQGMSIKHLKDIRNANGINVTAVSTPHPALVISMWDYEYLDTLHMGGAPAWQARGKDLLGPAGAADLLYGEATVARAVEANIGPTTQFLSDGSGVNFTVRNV
jgi:hypothetical protein